tara:strand:+ start:265 stop:735 length:471 start_codon:yes stop_codon:yes gene_type:complete
MVEFVINDQTIECEETMTILEAKKYIIQQLDLSCKYIDINFNLDKPMRVLGKFNVEPGKLARTLDRYPLERFAFKDSVKVEYEIVEGYDPDKRKPLMSGGRGRGIGSGRGSGRGLPGGAYIPPSRSNSTFNHEANQVELKLEPQFDLDSQDDFPSL